MTTNTPVQINSEAIKTVENKIVNIITSGDMSPLTITALDNVNIKGTCKLVDNKLLKSDGTEITFTSSGGNSGIDGKNLQLQLLYLSIKLDATLKYLSELDSTKNIKYIVDEVCDAAMVDKNN